MILNAGKDLKLLTRKFININNMNFKEEKEGVKEEQAEENEKEE